MASADKLPLGILIKQVAEETGFAETSVRTVLKSLELHIIEALAANQRVTLTGFGSFAPKIVAPRQVRNPQTGEVAMVDARGKVQFRPGKMMREIAEEALTRALQGGQTQDMENLFVLVDDEDDDGVDAASIARALFRSEVVEAIGTAEARAEAAIAEERAATATDSDEQESGPQSISA